MECLEIDLELITLHREEAGAPEPPPLEEIPAPVLPEARPPQRPPLPRRPGLAAPPLARRESGRPLAPAPPTAPPSVLQRTQLFIDKWRLEPTRAKLMLQGLRPEAAQWIINNFKPSSTAKDSRTGQLRTFISKSRETTPWNGSAAPLRRPPPRPVASSDDARGIKRSVSGSAIGASGLARSGAAASRGAGNPKPPLSAPKSRQAAAAPASRQAAARPNPPWGARQSAEKPRSAVGAASTSVRTPPPLPRRAPIGAHQNTDWNSAKRARTDAPPVSARPRSSGPPATPRSTPARAPLPPLSRPRPTDQVRNQPRAPTPSARNLPPRSGSSLNGGRVRPGEPGGLIKSLLG